jgi:triphosphoribosyl-dephospho-CoA synthase
MDALAINTSIGSLKANSLGELAYEALICEVTLSPKPGLVDSRNNGAHNDMNLEMMEASARSLKPYFSQMAMAGAETTSHQLLRDAVGEIGRNAEAAMLKTTGGVNTHKGAIWALGLLVTSLGMGAASETEMFQTSALLAGLTDSSLKKCTPVTNGQKVYCKYGIKGAKEEAIQGFPTIATAGLPALRYSREAGDNEDICQLNALLMIMSKLNDTCILSRAGLEGLETVQKGAARILTLGGAGTTNGFESLAELDKKLLSINASSGGAADLLAATILVDKYWNDIPLF